MATQVTVSDELFDHFAKVKEFRDGLLDKAIDNDPKTIISAMNSLTAVIRDLAKIQQELYNSDTFATLQQVVVSCLKEISPELQQKVLDEFELRRNNL